MSGAHRVWALAALSSLLWLECPVFAGLELVANGGFETDSIDPWTLSGKTAGAFFSTGVFPNSYNDFPAVDPLSSYVAVLANNAPSGPHGYPLGYLQQSLHAPSGGYDFVFSLEWGGTGLNPPNDYFAFSLSDGKTTLSDWIVNNSALNPKYAWTSDPNLVQDGAYHTFLFNDIALSGSAVLSFSFHTSDPSWFLLDDVGVFDVAPEPSSMTTVIASALFASLYLYRRRGRSAVSM
jgi:hypothetical protein